MFHGPLWHEREPQALAEELGERITVLAFAEVPRYPSCRCAWAHLARTTPSRRFHACACASGLESRITGPRCARAVYQSQRGPAGDIQFSSRLSAGCDSHAYPAPPHARTKKYRGLDGLRGRLYLTPDVIEFLRARIHLAVLLLNRGLELPVVLLQARLLGQQA